MLPHQLSFCDFHSRLAEPEWLSLKGNVVQFVLTCEQYNLNPLVAIEASAIVNQSS